MDRLATVVALALACMSGVASAGYAQVAAPVGWSAGGGSTYGSVVGRLGTAAANGGSFWSASTVINVGGRAVTMPVSGSFAANAGRFAARGLMANPLAITAAGAAWLASECIGRKDGAWVITCGGSEANPVSDGKEYRVLANGWTAWHPTHEAACAEAGGRTAGANAGFTLVGTSIRNGDCVIAGYAVGYPKNSESVAPSEARSTAACPAGWYITPAGCVATAPPTTLTPAEVEDKMAPKTVPPEVWPSIPNVPIPIGPPTINPSPAPNGPAAPLVVPLGDPTPVPGSNPTTWTQPQVRVTPAPTPNNPWQVDVTPQNQPVPDPRITPPQRDPYSLPSPGTSQDPNAPATPNPSEAVPTEADLCEKYPDILACAKFKLGEVEEQKIKNTDVPLKIEKEGGFPSGGQCPAPKVVPLMGKSFAFTIEPLCDFAKAIKPLLIGFAYLTAALTFLGVARRE